MTYYIGLDVAVKYAAICIVDGEGRVVRERALVTEPESLAAYLRGTGLAFERVGLEAGPLSSWLYEGLKAAGLPVICVESRHMKSALAAMRNKTDRQDARGIAQIRRQYPSHAAEEGMRAERLGAAGGQAGRIV